MLRLSALFTAIAFGTALSAAMLPAAENSKISPEHLRAAQAAAQTIASN